MMVNYSQVLILENLAVKGFKMKSSRIMDYPHVSLALRSLGEFHAYSFIIRIADPISFDKLKQIPNPIFFDTSSQNVENDEYIKHMCSLIGKVFNVLLIFESYIEKRVLLPRRKFGISGNNLVKIELIKTMVISSLSQQFLNQMFQF